MEPEAQETAKRAELKTLLEEIAGRELDMTDEQLKLFFWPIASSTYLAQHDTDVDAWTTNEQIIPLRTTVTDSKLVDTSGLSVTGSNGQLVFRLRNLIGPRYADGINQFFEPVSLLATPRGTRPFFMTISHTIIQDTSGTNIDVEITASAWNPDGTAAADVPFYWRCRVPTDSIIF